MSYSQELSKLENPSFEDFIRIASHNLSVSKRAYPWIGLSHGVKLLENDDELAQYLCAYGKMHKEKINSALQTIQKPSDYFTKKLTIIDWGCGQGLATICFFDYLRNLGIAPDVHKVILVEPSEPAINRAQEHLCKYIDNDKLSLVNKYINDVSKDDLSGSNGLVVHFFSNILDIPSVDVDYLADLIRDSISSEQLFFCVGPQNIGASRISVFAKLFDIEDDDLIEEHSGRLSGRGTINLLVFRVKAEVAEVIKVEYHHRRSLSLENCSALQRVMKDATTEGNLSEKALQFYRSVVELERMKSASLGNPYPYPIHVVSENGTTKINIDIQENPDFESQFKKNSDPAYEKWPKNLNIGIGLIFGNRLFLLLQYVYPYEDIKHIDIESQYVSVELPSFSLNPDVAEELEIGEEQIGVIESIISDPSTTWDSLLSLLKDAISNDVEFDSHIYLSLSAENPALAQINSELKQLESKKDGTLLNQFLSGNIPDNHTGIYDEDVLLEVKSSDESQRKAIATALSSRVSVITGPPGTGKTQMILNLIANAFVKGKTVLVASKNNKAVDNIKERYDGIEPLHYLLRFGSKDAVKNQVLPYLESILQRMPQLSANTQRYHQLLGQYRYYEKAIHDGREMLRKLVVLEEEYKTYPEKIQAQESELVTISSSYESSRNNLSLKHAEYLELSRCGQDWSHELTKVKMQINSLQSRYSGLGKLFFDWFSKKKNAETALNTLLLMPVQFTAKVESLSGIMNVADVVNGRSLILLYEKEKFVIEQIIACSNDFANLEKNYGQKQNAAQIQLDSLISKRAECKRQLDLITESHARTIGAIESGRKGIKDISIELFNLAVLLRLNEDNASAIISRYKNYLPDHIPWRNNEVGVYKDNAQAFSTIFRLNAVTNLSIKNSYPLSNGFFDMVIIDEASQCDVASALPLIYRAKQLVVIGDPLQLKHISAVNADEEMAIKEHLDIAENPLIKYADYSLWDYCKDLITTANENNHPVVLDCHYRCHPQIIGYSNRMFYEKKLGTTLNVKTIEKNPLLDPKGIIWVDVRGVQKSNMLNINEAEVSKCIALATQLADQYPNISIGIISPFKHQSQEINARIPLFLRERVVSDTVHKFQGDERDVIIYSLVVTDNSPDTKIRWIDRSVPNLVNVAVTRARTTLYIVGNKRYIKEHSRIDLPLGNLADYTENRASAPSNEPTKTYIIDTNVFVNCPTIIDYINPRDVIVLSAKVVDELDKLKTTLDDESKRNVETALRHINSKFSERNIRMECADMNYLPADFSKKNPDNLILSIAVKFRNQNPVLLTSDNGFQVKAKGLGIPTIKLKDFLR